MSKKIFTGFNRCWRGEKPATQVCPNCQNECLNLVDEEWKCWWCDEVYEVEKPLGEPDTIQTKKFKVNNLTFQIHLVKGQYWVECLASDNRRFQYTNPRDSFSNAVFEAKWFADEFEGDPEWLPQDWVYVGWGTTSFQGIFTMKLYLGSPCLELVSLGGEKFYFFDHDALAVYWLISENTGLQIFNPAFYPMCARQVTESIDVDFEEI